VAELHHRGLLSGRHSRGLTYFAVKRTVPSEARRTGNHIVISELPVIPRNSAQLSGLLSPARVPALAPADHFVESETRRGNRLPRFVQPRNRRNRFTYCP
jgi:hypothetical protein